ncbi:MAG: M36 family metallopeptidase [Chloroflexota bacterium]|nr:M36 family metallopeptidase [Chloroflexota bacterium]
MGAQVRWNQYGTPRTLFNPSGYITTGVAGTTAPVAARNWLASNRRLFKLSSVDNTHLQLINDSPLIGTSGHAVVFRQVFGGLPTTNDGMITVGLTGTRSRGWKISYVSSSLTGDTALAAQSTLSAPRAIQLASASVGRPVSLSSIARTAPSKLAPAAASPRWTLFKLKGFSQPARARLVALPTPRNGVRPAYETLVMDFSHGRVLAMTVFVDAATGATLLKVNRVDDAANFQVLGATQNYTFTGTMPAPGECGPQHSFNAPSGTRQIVVAATSPSPQNDIVLRLYYNGKLLMEQDTGTNPEFIRYAPSGGVPAGPYSVQVCTFPGSKVAPAPNNTYTVNVTVTDQPLVPLTNAPRWKYFRAYPRPDYSSTDIRLIGCWNTILQGDTPPAGCGADVANLASRSPWDYDPLFNQPTYTTFGNNAFSLETWFSPYSPGPTGYMPTSLNRRYIYSWSDQWNNQRCNPALFSAGYTVGPDKVPVATTLGTPVDRAAAVTNLFVMHNRMHDFAYYLGFTETNYNMQLSNFGNTNPGGFPYGFEVDPEIGDAQAGAVVGGYPDFFGRDNANQITPNDGIPPISNMYLWQPIPSSFYAPCVDGDFDMSIIGHEYTHAISNRMVAGPDEGLAGYQAGSMGESWSDLVATEFLHAYNLVPLEGENPWAVGTYVTGNKRVGIRNYALNNNPLNYSDLGYDRTGAEVHADGEIWNAVNYEIRQLLVNKYNARYPASNLTLQRRCANGEVAVSLCPGNRRWIQIMFDAFLLMPSNVDMLDARNAYLAADRMRFGGANQAELWLAFARRGMGRYASTTGTNDVAAKPSFASPRARNASVTFRVTTPLNDGTQQGGEKTVGASIYVGDYEARAVPVADTLGNTVRGPSASFAPGTYRFLVRAAGYGFFRFTRTFTAGQQVTLKVSMPSNWASQAKGATARGDGVDHAKLIDESERTDWDSEGRPVRGRSVTVNLSGGSHRVTRVQVSAMLPTPREVPRETDVFENRFTALRQFEIWACTASAANSNCTSGGFRRVYVSPANAFPAVRPRPMAPNLILRNFDVPDFTATHVRLRVVSSQCTGAPDYQGEQDNDPRYGTDCDTNSPNGTKVHAAELQVFSSTGSVSSSGDTQQRRTSSP